MKIFFKLQILVGILLLLATCSYAQLYRGITFTDKYSPQAYPTLVVPTISVFNNADDQLSNVITPGGTFIFGGKAFTGFFVSTNGFIILTNRTAGTTPLSAGLQATGYPSNNLSAIPSGAGPVIAPLWDDLRDSVVYKVRTVSTIPQDWNIEYKSVYWDKGAVTPYASRILIRLGLTTSTSTVPGSITFFYLPYTTTLPQAWGPYANTSSVSPAGASIGFADTCGGDFYSLVAPVNASPPWSNLTALKTTETNSINNLGAPPIAANISQSVAFSVAFPVNDQCINALPLAVSMTNTCNPSAFTLINATKVGSFGAITCATLNDTNDVWFLLTRPASIRSFIISTDFPPLCHSATVSLEVFAAGNPCSALGIPIACASSGGNVNLNNAIVTINDSTNVCGSVSYYVRVAGDAGAIGNFQICAHNNKISDCATATVIPSIPFTQTCNTTCGSLNNYTGNMACGSNYLQGEDYVYKYHSGLVPECLQVALSNVNGSRPGLFIFSACPDVAIGADCIASDSSGSNPIINSATIPPNTDIYIVVDSKDTGSCINKFDINVTHPIGNLENDEACGARQLILAGNCNWSGTFSTVCATHSPVSSADCGNLAFTAPDIWFSFVVPNSGSVNINTRPGSFPVLTDVAMALYSGTDCASLTMVSGQCSRSGSDQNLLFPFLSATDLIPGSTMYLRVWSENSVQGTIQLCVTDCYISGLIVNDVNLNCNVPVDTLRVFPTSNDTLAYSWTPGGDTVSFIPVDHQGIYCVTATNTTNGCFISACGTVVSNIVIPNVLINSGIINCQGDSTFVTVSSIGGYPPYTGTGTFTVAAGTYTYTITDSHGCSQSASVSVADGIACTAILDVKLFIQGFYIGGGLMAPVLFTAGVEQNPLSTQTDTVTIHLREVINPNTVAYSFTGIVHTNGIIHCQFPEDILGNYYFVVINHRNSIQTWSKNPVLFANRVTDYNFTDSLSKAFDDGVNPPMKRRGNVYTIYNGDLNQDGTIDILDMVTVDNDATIFSFGYFPSDCNGDGSSDILDMGIVDNNAKLFLYLARPY